MIHELIFIIILAERPSRLEDHKSNRRIAGMEVL